MFAQLRLARRMGSAAAIGVGSWRSSSCLLLQRSRGRRLSFSSPTFSIDAPSSSVASSRCLCFRQVLSHFSSSTAGRRSCSTIREGGSQPKRGGLQYPAMALTASGLWAPTTEMKSVPVTEQVAKEMVEKVIIKNTMEVMRGMESVAGKLGELRMRLGKLEGAHKSPGKAMQMVEERMEVLWKKFEKVNLKSTGVVWGTSDYLETESELEMESDLDLKEFESESE